MNSQSERTRSLKQQRHRPVTGDDEGSSKRVRFEDARKYEKTRRTLL